MSRGARLVIRGGVLRLLPYRSRWGGPIYIFVCVVCFVEREKEKCGVKKERESLCEKTKESKYIWNIEVSGDL